MATTTYGADKNDSPENVTETTGSGATMTKGVEVNIDLAKITSRDEALRALAQIEDAIVSSVNWPA